MKSANVEAIYRLSPTQEGMLYHCLVGGAQERGGGDGTYLVQYSCVYRHVDADCLRKAWVAVVARHSVLRTLFTWERRNQPLQIVRQHVELEIQQHDWRGLPAPEQERRWRSHLQRDRDRGFDLEQAPLMRFDLLRMDDERSRFFWSFHHLLLDGWSMRLVVDEVSRVYGALRRAEQPDLPPTRPFGDFIGWLDQRDSSGEEPFWRDYLRGFQTPTTLDLPRERAASSRSAGVREHILDAACLAALTRRARAERLTVSILVTAAWSLVLSRNANTDDVVFGTTVAGRPPELSGVEAMAGLFINTLPLRVRVRPLASVREWLSEVQRQQRAVLAHEHTPLVAVKRASELPPDTPLFESIVGYKNIPPHDADAEAALVGSDENYVEYSNYPLALLAVPDQTLSLIMVYDPARFSRDAVDRLLAQVANVLTAMSLSLDGSVDSLPVLPGEELVQVTPASDSTAVDFGPPCCVHELVAGQAHDAPDAMAVIDAEGTLSYSQLRAAAVRLATRLTARGVTRELPVPVLMGRTRSAIVAMLAVLEAGGAYVPLDPAWPADRIARILDDLDNPRALVAVLCDADGDAALGEHAGIALAVDVSGAIDTTQDTAPSSPCDAGQLAYIVYTSGSTGQPKGVMVTHANLFNSVRAREVFYPNTPEVFLLLSPLATDSSMAGLFWTLCCGGTLLLPASRSEQNAAALSDLVAEHGATHTLCLPSLLAALIESTEPARLASLDTVIVAGEACAADVVSSHHRALPGARLYNEYGPSEATVWATATELRPQPDDHWVPLGLPVANTTVFVLDDRLRPTPLGVAGELCIGGANVARGYHRQPERSAERFVANPFSDTPGARLYRTGDRVRRHADGRLEFLGRLDNQLKVRGYRVEPEEIEAVLNSHADVAESAVGIVSGSAPAHTHDDVDRLARVLQRLEESQAEQLLADIEQSSAAEVDARLARASHAGSAS